MALTAKAAGGTDYTPIEAGVHLAVCYGVYDLGTHHDDIYDKDQHKIVILWEVPDSRIEIERDGIRKDLPRAISSRYTLSLGEKARLRKDLESWRGRPFTAQELEGFDLRNILGKSCQLNIVHNVSKDGAKTFANIAAIMGLPKGVHPLSLENEMQWYSMEEGQSIPETTPEWIRTLIGKSNEVVAANQTHGAPPEVASPGEHAYTPADEPPDYTDDIIPF